MKQTKFILKFAIIFCGFIDTSGICLYAQANIHPNEKTISYLSKFRADYIKAMLEKKPDLIHPYYSEAVRLMPAFQKTVMGKSNAMLYHKVFSDRFIINEFNRKEIEILDLGEQVLEIGTLMMKIMMRVNSKEYELLGTYLNIWKESDKGELSLITEAWNYSSYYGEVHEHLKFEEVPGIYAALLPNVLVNTNISFQLNALNRLLDETVTQHDGNIWSQYYADDAMLIPGYHPPRKGRKEIDEYIHMHVKELPVFEELDIRNDRIDSLGAFVIEYASHIASWRNGNSSGVGLGKNIRVWRREPDHSLKLFRSIGMYD